MPYFPADGGQPGGHVPASRLAPIVQAWVGADEKRTLVELAELTGTSDRALREWISGKREWARFSTADRVVTRIDVTLWLTPPEDGGLNDVYERAFHEVAVS